MLRIGQIVGSFGIKGQVKVRMLTDFAERFEVGKRVMVGDQWTEIEGAMVHKNQLILKLSGVEDRNGSEALYGKYVETADTTRPELEEDEYFTEDLIGLTVMTAEGEVLGKVDSVNPAPAHDILVVGEILIPAVKAFVKKVDLEQERITVELIPGMRPGEE